MANRKKKIVEPKTIHMEYNEPSGYNSQLENIISPPDHSYPQPQIPSQFPTQPRVISQFPTQPRVIYEEIRSIWSDGSVTNSTRSQAQGNL